MRIALTGGTGYVGGHVARRLQAAGYALRLLTRHPSAVVLPGAETALLDLETEIDTDTLRGCDALLHLAAYIPADHADPANAERCWRVNAWGTLRLAEAAARAGVRHVVHTTSGNAYSPGGGRPRHEGDAMMPTSRGYYLGSKILQEIYAAEACSRNGLACTALRLGSVYGGTGATGLVSHLIDKLKANQPVVLHGGGLFGADFVHVEDVADAVLLVIQRSADGAFNVGSGERTTILTLARTIAGMCAASDHLIEITPTLSDRDTGFAALDCSRLGAQGYAPRRFMQGLTEAMSQ